MDSFVFKNTALNKEKNEVSFSYSLVRTAETFDFTEKLVLPETTDWSKFSEKSVQGIVEMLHLLLGVSYWKTFCPKKIELGTISLNEDQAAFWNTVYTKGLGEFFYKNNIDFRGLVNFPFTKESTSEKKALPIKTLGMHPLVLIGGGKDSLVSVELIKEKKIPFSLFSLNDYPIMRETAEIIRAELIVIKRVIDPKLIELNKRADVYNGHVPISLIYSVTATLAALLFGFDSVVLSAEKSADYGNVEYLGEMINHQWSKSAECEVLLRNYLGKYISQDVAFENLIGEMSELQVAEIFSRYPQYRKVFTSCNRNFAFTKAAERKWCGECPKCAFVFALLSAFIPKTELVEIFGKNLFADKNLLPLYRELLGVEAFKPFECVGTPEETKQAFTLAHQRGEYESDTAMKMFLSLQ